MSNEKLIHETIQSIEEFLPKVSHSCLIITEQIRSDNESQAMYHINQFIAAVEWLTQAINGIKSLGYIINIDTKEINQHLLETKEGLENNDLVLIADMFEYELYPMLEGWTNEIYQYKGE
ncbi:hypothetical protein IHV12_03920 [Fictibacillus sp. 7GRE50]|uniref:hypothetical protein n=1 Tax=Fictibacillus sp. 7GRE50 TaxID=2745878 RepID=UPI0018CE0E58|nr:hypothetical protein [Fictibacillus sp. 7GRE50]MBH0164046.1 hypothetical protein [Fictibacillus sp. 7GRE50]